MYTPGGVGGRMANNRLYLYDPDTHEAFLLAKTLASGWYVNYRRAGDGPEVGEDLDGWFELRDVGASYGSCAEPTRLRLCTEQDLPKGAHLHMARESL
jgi:hypothetical protein